MSAIRESDVWLGELPHRTKLVTPSNHEFFLEAGRRRDPSRRLRRPPTPHPPALQHTPAGEITMPTQTNPITVEQYLSSFEGCPGWNDELINGRIVMSPGAKPLHQQIQRNIQRALEVACKDTDYIVNGDSNINFQHLDSSPSPNVFVATKESWRRAIDSGEYLDTVPLIAVEILSPSQKEVHEKVDIYRSAGVREVWVVSPKNKTVTIHMPEGVIETANDILLSPPLSGRIAVEDLFRVP